MFSLHVCTCVCVCVCAYVSRDVPDVPKGIFKFVESVFVKLLVCHD
jgi:hypothetical protein